MAVISISNFSCIKDATLTLSPVIVLIGPQGSGKSVTTKLSYFFNDILRSHVAFAERGETLESFKRQLGKQFRDWFPPSAWGRERFNINYTNGEFTVRVLRRLRDGKQSDELAISFSDWFEVFYKLSLNAFNRHRPQGQNDLIVTGSEISDPLEIIWRVRENIYKSIGSNLNGDFIQTQTFIPAGRASYTSIGRIVAGLENIGTFDPIGIRFAKLFATLRERSGLFASRSRFHRLHPDVSSRHFQFMKRLIGGEIVQEDEAEYVKTEDGRKIPFSALSSGQQELLPMWALIDYFAQMDHLRVKNSRKAMEVLYIEEPEAHLFPSAQSLFLEFLLGSLRGSNSVTRSIILTTHSPYIMGRLNVFLKAGQLSRRKKRNTDINAVVPRECWLSNEDFAAYAIEDGKLRSIVDEEDGLIDASYLDGISHDIENDFDRLLKIEAEIR